MTPRFIIEQKITAFTNQYRIYNASQNGEKGDLRAFAQQKRLAFKEKVTFYTSEDKSAVAFTFRAEKVMDVHGKYLVEDENEQLVGMFQKQFKRSLVSSTWNILDTKGTAVMVVRESNFALALFRRFAGFIPIIGDLFELIDGLFKFHFVFESPDESTEYGRHQKTTLFRDHYTLSLTDDAQTLVDWRVFAAMGVALDALQSR